MDHDDDVEHLFSWLQTPELRYREFAGAREITDTIVIWQARPTSEDTPVAPPENVQLAEEYPPDQFPDQQGAPADFVVQNPAAAAGPAMESVAAEPPVGPAGPFSLGASGRGAPSQPHYEEPVIQTPAPRQAAPPPPMPPSPVVPPPSPPPSSMPSPALAASAQPAAVRPAGSGLLGGAYRTNGSNGHGTDAVDSSADKQQRGERSLDAVFGRLAGGNARRTAPREQLRHISGFAPPANRSR
jgi:hypothetical protein